MPAFSDGRLAAFAPDDVFRHEWEIFITVKIYIWNKREYLSFFCGIFLMIIEKTTELIFSLKED